jgi:energy-coupling factor transport system permease protein
MNLHPRTWMAWVAAAAVVAMIARNPIYSVIILVVSRMVILAQERQDERSPLLSWRVSLLVLLFSTAYSAFFVHGGRTVLVVLPDWPLVGGPVTAEAAADGLRNGLVLLALLSVFGAMNAAVRVGDLVRLIPVALQDLGVVVLIAITYVPETRRHLDRIREAQAIRGHQLGGLAEWRPVIIPLLVGGLERAMQLAEAMVARGYGATSTLEQSRSERLALLAALSLGLVGWLASFWVGWPGWLLLGVGGAVVAALLRRRGERQPRTHYRVTTWRRADTLALVAAVTAVLVVVVPLPFSDSASLVYVPYPRLSLPPFDWLIGLGLAALGLPALLAPRGGDSPDRLLTTEHYYGSD